MILQSFKMAWKAIASNKMRSFLTMLGIIIGVLSLVVLVSLVSSTTDSVTDSINSLGSNTLSVTISDDKGVPIKLSDLSTFTDDEEIDEISPIAESSVTASSTYFEETTTAYGTTGAYSNIQGLELSNGRFIMNTDIENHLNNILLERFNEDDEAFTIINQSDIMETLSSVTNVLALLLGGIAGISLLVGGIGIMNIMLVSVTERTSEIGIRKAIGASRGTIMLQFLIEAFVVSIMGCLIGILLSWIIIGIINHVGNVNYGLSTTVVWIAMAFSTGIGLIFGLYPAHKAASKKPIDALRFI